MIDFNLENTRNTKLGERGFVVVVVCLFLFLNHVIVLRGIRPSQYFCTVLSVHFIMPICHPGFYNVM